MDDKNFDEISAKNWISLIDSSDKSQRDNDIYPKINDWLRNANVENLLDIGCGQGVLSGKIRNTNISYIGVEPSDHLLNKAKINYPDHNFIKGNLYDLPFKDQCFQGVLALAVWHLVENISQAHKELSRVLKSGGEFLLVLPDANSSKEWTTSYSKYTQNGNKITGYKDENVIEDVIYLRNIEEIERSLNEFNLNIFSVEKVRIWNVIIGKKSN